MSADSAWARRALSAYATERARPPAPRDRRTPSGTAEPAPGAEAATATATETKACPSCDGSLVVIDLELDGEAALLQSCSACGLRSWLLDGRPADLRTVLDVVPNRKARRAARELDAARGNGTGP